MTWFKVDDTFHSHPKVLGTDPSALGLWVIAGSWSSAHMTGGLIPKQVLERLLPDALKQAESLVEAGLWRRLEFAYKFHDWTAYNPSSKEARDLRTARAEAGRKGGLASGKSRSKNEANASGFAESTVEPRPDPSPKGRVGSPTLPVLGAAPARKGEATPEKPAWCGHCDPRTRLFEIDGRAIRCARCHPLTQQEIQ